MKYVAAIAIFISLLCVQMVLLKSAYLRGRRDGRAPLMEMLDRSHQQTKDALEVCTRSQKTFDELYAAFERLRKAKACGEKL